MPVACLGSRFTARRNRFATVYAARYYISKSIDGSNVACSMLLSSHIAVKMQVRCMHGKPYLAT